MSILFVLLTFIVIVTFNYLHSRNTPDAMTVSPEVPVRPKVPVMAKELGFSVPQGYSFHPGHAWVVREGHGSARVGLDSFAADLIGKIDQIAVGEAADGIGRHRLAVDDHGGAGVYDRDRTVARSPARQFQRRAQSNTNR